MIRMNTHCYSKKQLEAMNTTQLLNYAKSLGIPADSNWKTEQIVSVIEYYQAHNSQNFSIINVVKQYLNVSIAKTVFIIIALIGLIYLKSTESCPTGLCNLATSEIQSNTSNRNSPKTADAIHSITNEFASVAKKSSDKVQQRYDELIDSLQDLDKLYKSCQQNMSKIKLCNVYFLSP